MNATRIQHGGQAGSRLTPTDTLFESVPQAVWRKPLERPEVGEASESDWQAWLETVPGELAP